MRKAIQSVPVKPTSPDQDVTVADETGYLIKIEAGKKSLFNPLKERARESSAEFLQ